MREIKILLITPCIEKYLLKPGEKRIIDYRWEHYDYRHVVFRPRNMTPAQLQNGVDWIIGEFYSRRNIARRVLTNFSKPNLFRNLFVTLPINIGYHRDARRWVIRGELPTGGRVRAAASNNTSVLQPSDFPTRAVGSTAG
jgi:hypothetical protein